MGEREEGQPQPDNKFRQATRLFGEWRYEDHFKDYLIQVGLNGKKGIEPIENFPKRIELSDQWHETFDKVRKDSKDKFERYAVTGIQGWNKIYIPTEFAKADKPYSPISQRAGLEQRSKARESGVNVITGDIHSHPGQDFKDRILEKVIMLYDYTGFSAGDLWRLVSPGFLPFSFVIEIQENLLALRTRETIRIPADSPLNTMDQFTRFWCLKHGMVLYKNEPMFIPPVVFNLWEMDLAIANHHNLVLYRGKPGRALIRAYP